MSQETSPYDFRTRRTRDDGYGASYDDADYVSRRARPDRSHVVSIRWGASDDADAERVKYNKAAAEASGLWKRLALYVTVFLIVVLGLWRYAGHRARLSRQASASLWDERAQAVVGAFRHAWTGYETDAWGFDELKPISQSHSTWMNVGMTIIDSLDTALVMDQHDIFQKALDWVTDELRFDYDGDSNVFELTIRVLGGLLSAYHMTEEKHPALLARAKELADILLLAFDTPSKLPLESINFATRQPRAANAGAGPGSTAEITTLSLEFKYLSFLTGDKTYWDAVDTIERVIADLEKVDGLAPIFVSTSTGQWTSREVRLGSRGDSYYEYLGKQYLLTDDKRSLVEYRAAVAGIRKHLLGLSHPNEYFFIGELPSGVASASLSYLSPKMDHLVCFLPGTLALIATRGKKIHTMAERLALEDVDLLDLELAEELAIACWQQYTQTSTGLSPEIVFWKTKPLQDSETNGTVPAPSIAEIEYKRHKDGASSPRPTTVSRYFGTTVKKDIRLDNLPFHGSSIRPPPTGKPVGEDFSIHARDGHNLLRPETIESFFVLFRITGDPVWRERGWEMFEAFEKWCKVKEGGYSSLDDVRVQPPVKRDKMETYFMSETLKYFYLLFSEPPSGDDAASARRLVDLEQYVFNTEAHPLPKFRPPPDFE